MSWSLPSARRRIHNRLKFIFLYEERRTVSNRPPKRFYATRSTDTRIFRLFLLGVSRSHPRTEPRTRGLGTVFLNGSVYGLSEHGDIESGTGSARISVIFNC